MQDWEVLAMDERSIREGLAERASVLEDQLSSQKEEHASAAAQRDELSLAVNGLQRALQDLQDGTRRSFLSPLSPFPPRCPAEFARLTANPNQLENGNFATWSTATKNRPRACASS